jgi:hypothetical protein
MSPPDTSTEALFEKALAIAESYLERAMTEAGDIAPYVAVAMVEAAVNQAVEATGPGDIADMLRDLADQIEADADEDEEA